MTNEEFLASIDEPGAVRAFLRATGRGNAPEAKAASAALRLQSIAEYGDDAWSLMEFDREAQAWEAFPGDRTNWEPPIAFTVVPKLVARR